MSRRISAVAVCCSNASARSLPVANAEQLWRCATCGVRLDRFSPYPSKISPAAPSALLDRFRAFRPRRDRGQATRRRPGGQASRHAVPVSSDGTSGRVAQLPQALKAHSSNSRTLHTVQIALRLGAAARRRRLRCGGGDAGRSSRPLRPDRPLRPGAGEAVRIRAVARQPECHVPAPSRRLSRVLCVLEGQVIVTTVLHKRETFTFYREEPGMKTMTVFEARNHFARTLEAAKKDIVIGTRNGKPVATIQAIDDDDIEDLLLKRSPRFWDMINRARRGSHRDRRAAKADRPAGAARQAPRPTETR